MLPTPSTTHANKRQIYDPAEDTFLLLDALSAPAETAYLTARFAPPSPSPLALEVGTGSGAVLAFLLAHAARITGRADVLAAASDVNPHACAAVGRTVAGACASTSSASPSSDRGAADAGAGAGAGFLGAARCDLATALRPGCVDMLVFNPPYVPSDSVPALPALAAGQRKTEDEFALLAVATDGGADGMEVTARLLGQLPAVLSARGVAYVVLCGRNRPAEVQAAVAGWEGGSRWEARIVRDTGRMGGMETLCILRVARVLPIEQLRD